MKGTVQVHYTVGAGNNIFQYVFSKLLSYMHDCNLSGKSLNFIDVKESFYPVNKLLPTVNIGFNEQDFGQYLDFLYNFYNMSPRNFVVQTHPEDYTIYKNYIPIIKTWFKNIETSHPDDLVFHLRLGDRLFYKNEYIDGMFTSVQDYIDAIQRFNYKKLYIVTDMPIWKNCTSEEISSMKFHVDVPMSERVNCNIYTDYFNSLVDGLSSFNPHVRTGHSIKEDFEFMRSFGQILFKHGTLSWWAAALSNASRVGVYGPWRPAKGIKNKNLGKTDFDGWFQWGG